MTTTTTNTTAPTTTQIDDEFGAWLPGRWVPAPRYLLRRARVLDALAGLPAGRVVEVGCGAAALLHDLHRRGHACTGLEHSAAARDVARALHAATDVVVCEGPGDDWAGRFDALVSCEVLEHIDDDRGALSEWVGWLKPGARVVLSAPAHPTLFGPTDTWAGHVRRYTRAGFAALAAHAGLRVDRVESYGFPAGYVTMALRTAALVARPNRGGSAAENTAASGVERSVEVGLYGAQQSRAGRWALRAALRAQEPFLSTRLGEGYLLVATKP